MSTFVIAVYSGKGGVGKTSTTAGIIAVAAKRGMKVAGGDLDPRCTLTKELGVTQPEFSLNDLLYLDPEGKDVPGDPAVLVHQVLTPAGPQWPSNALILPSERPLGLRETAGTSFELRLQRALLGLDEAGIDLLVLDLPPRSGGKLVTVGLSAARNVLVPTTLTADGHDGAVEALKSVRFQGAAGGPNPDLQVAGVFRSIVPRPRDRRDVHQHWDQQIAEEFSGQLLDTEVHSYAVREVCRTACAPITKGAGREARALEESYGELLDHALKEAA